MHILASGASMSQAVQGSLMIIMAHPGMLTERALDRELRGQKIAAARGRTGIRSQRVCETR